MNVTNFSTNWNNKLHNQCFSALRLKSAKYQRGDQHEIQLKKQTICYAQIVLLKEIKLSQLTEGICLLDTGYNKQETVQIIEKMYPNVHIQATPFYWIVFKRICQADVEQQSKLF